LTADKLDVRGSPPDFFAEKRGFDLVQGAKQAQCEIIDTDPYHGFIFHFYPGVTGVQVVSLGNSKAFYIENIHRFYNGVDTVLIEEKLIKFAIPATVFVGTGPKGYAVFHMVDAGAIFQGAFTKPFTPGNDLRAFSG